MTGEISEPDECPEPQYWNFSESEYHMPRSFLRSRFDAVHEPSRDDMLHAIQRQLLQSDAVSTDCWTPMPCLDIAAPHETASPETVHPKSAQIASILTRDLGERHYIVCGNDCYIVEDVHSGIMSSDWLSASTTINDESTHIRVCNFATIEGGVATPNREHVETEPSGELFDTIRLGASISLWQSHADALTMIVSGGRGVLTECEFLIEPFDEDGLTARYELPDFESRWHDSPDSPDTGETRVEHQRVAISVERPDGEIEVIAVTQAFMVTHHGISTDVDIQYYTDAGTLIDPNTVLDVNAWGLPSEDPEPCPEPVYCELPPCPGETPAHYLQAPPIPPEIRRHRRSIGRSRGRATAWRR